MPTTKKKAAKKPPKKRVNKYEKKFVVNGSFEEVIKALVTPKFTSIKK